MKETIWRHWLYRDGRFEPLANSARSLTWAYKLKTLKSSSQISATNWLKVSLMKFFQYIWWAAMLYNKDDDADLLYLWLCSYLYLVFLLYRVLKKTYFKQHLSVVASKYSLSDTQNNTQSKLCSMFQYSPNENGIVYGPNGI